MSDFSSTTIGKPMQAELGGEPIAIVDALGRPMRDLRISVTDRCNLRCTYCMPRHVFNEHHQFLPRTELLSFEEIERLAKQFIRLGVRKIRLTGGEPLLRRGIAQLIERLAELRTGAGVPVEIALTTNGVLLARMAQQLKEAGLSRITVSLDGLSENTFRNMSDSDVSVRTVLDGIEEAQRVGLAPVKVNMVVRRGVSDHEVLPMAEHFRGTGVVLRYIEYMDVGNSNNWRMDEVVAAREILERLSEHYSLHQADAGYRGEVAERWYYADGGGEVGIIASVTQAFCHECTRIRLSTDGKLYFCLFGGRGIDLRAPLRAGMADEQLRELIARNWQARADRYSELRHTNQENFGSANKVEMSYIGG